MAVLMGAGNTPGPAGAAAHSPTSAATRSLRLLLFIVTAGLVTTGCVAQVIAGVLTQEPTVEDGRKLYQEHCVSCHGQRGDRIPASPLSSREFLESRRDPGLVASIGEGKGVMPSFSKTREGPLSDEQIRVIVAYVNFSAGRNSSTLLAGKGRAVYRDQCARCHGDKGDRVPVAPLTSDAFMDTRSDAQLLEAVGDGIGVMPGFSHGTGPTLKEEQIKAVVAYLRYNVDALHVDRIRRGRDVYVSKCLSCHGERGDRAPGIGLATADFLRKIGDDAFATAVADGKGKMPGFVRTRGGTLVEDDIGAVLAYAKSWAGIPVDLVLVATAPPPAAAGAPAGGGAIVAKGKELFAKSCTACHGDQGDKLPTAKLNDPAWLQQRGDAGLTDGIAIGKGGMPGFGKEKGGAMSADDVSAVLAYMKSLAGVATGSGAAPGGAGPVALGKELFTKSCTACHGDQGDKLPTAKLNDKAYLEKLGEAGLTSGIAVGKGGMPGFGKEKGGAMSADDVGAVVAYVRSLAGMAPAAESGHGAQAAPAAAKPDAPAAPAAKPAAPAAAAKPAAPVAAAKPAAPAAASPTEEVLIARGNDLYRQHCTACHGDTKAKMGRLADGAWLQQRGDRVLLRGIAEGKSLPGAKDAMPGFGKEKGGALSSDDVTAVLGYLKSVAGIPLVAAAEAGGPDLLLGKELFTKSCTACHGAQGDLLPSAKLNDPAWLQQRGDAGLTSGISAGTGAMPGFGKEKGGALGPDDIGSVLAYMKSLAGLAPTSGGGGADLALGKELYTQSCTACHGDKGDKLPSSRLNDSAFVEKLGDAGLTSGISVGKAAMPGFSKEKGGKLGPDDVAAVVAYIRSLAGLGPGGR